MFPKDSAFSTDSKVAEHLERMRKQALEREEAKKTTEKTAAYDLLVAARMLLDSEEYEGAGQLIDEAMADLEN